MRPPTIRRLVTTLATALLLAAAVVPTAAQPVAADGGATFVDVVNGYRSRAGLPDVRLHAVVDDIAVQRTRAMAAARDLNHDLEYVKQRLAAAGICWSRVGEIVAYNYTGTISDFGSQWYNSDGHRAIMMNSAYTHAGGSRESAGGKWWAVMVFVDICRESSQTGFTDIGDSKFREDILWLVNEKITYGCSDTRFCPDGLVTRGQMASFLSRARSLPSTSADYFRDDDTSSHEASINRVARAAITAGCDDDRYCPSGRVTRAQMATFLVRALGLPATSRDYFRDDERSPHEDNINRVAAAGMTGGCGEGRFCPDGLVTRGQMAAFLHRAFE